jgi:hypothetical protein
MCTFGNRQRLRLQEHCQGIHGSKEDAHLVACQVEPVQ